MSTVLSPASKTINVQIPEGIFSQLEDLARATDRSKSFLTAAALSSYLKQESWQVKDIQDGIAEADSKAFASDEEVEAVFAKYGA